MKICSVCKREVKMRQIRNEGDDVWSHSDIEPMCDGAEAIDADENGVPVI